MTLGDLKKCSVNGKGVMATLLNGKRAKLAAKLCFFFSYYKRTGGCRMFVTLLSKGGVLNTFADLEKNIAQST